MRSIRVFGEDPEQAGHSISPLVFRDEIEENARDYPKRWVAAGMQGETMSRPVSRENPYLEITSEKVSETLKRELNSMAIQVLTIENVRALRPDIMGFVQRTSLSDKELMTVEVKAKPIKIKDILQAKFYQEAYSPTFNSLVSSKGIPEKKSRFLLDNDCQKRRYTHC